GRTRSVHLTLFIFKVTLTSDAYTLSLHDALPICDGVGSGRDGEARTEERSLRLRSGSARQRKAERNETGCGRWCSHQRGESRRRSEEHTSELQSRFDLVCRLLLEKKKNYKYMRRL